VEHSECIACLPGVTSCCALFMDSPAVSQQAFELPHLFQCSIFSERLYGMFVLIFISVLLLFVEVHANYKEVKHLFRGINSHTFLQQ
jgi:hypothetical protein